MIYRFGDYELDTHLFELRCNGTPLPLEPKVFDLLTYLIRYRERVVTKQELLVELWPHQFVSDAALSYCVMAGRKAVGDNGRRQRVIKTLYERGYRFVAAVEGCGDGTVARAESVAEGHATAPTAEVPWEPKLVTVLAIDVSWPPATEQNTAHEVPWTTVRRWHHVVADTVEGFGALLVQQAASPLIAVFGMPRTMEQMPLRAVQAALALREMVAAGGEQESACPGPELRLAIHTGQVLVDVHAYAPREQLLTIGDTLSRPVRLLGHAAPNDILLSSEVAGLVEGWFELCVCEGPAATSSASGVRTYAVVGLGPRRSSLEAYGKRPLSRFVGRKRELAMLYDCLTRVKKGHGQLVSLVGEPGVGKSRVCYEFSQSPHTRGWLILQSSPSAYGKEIPYVPIVDLLRTYFRLDARDEPRAIYDKIVTKLQALDHELASIGPPLLALLDLPVEDPAWQTLEPTQRRQRTLDALKRLLVRESQARPVLVIVENLHWIDTETQACLEGLVQSLPSARLLLLVNYRPEYQHHWGGKTYYMQLRLDPLGPEHAAELLRAILGTDTSLSPLAQLLIEQTQGNPFFLEECIHTLVETQVLVGMPGAYRSTQVVQHFRVPATVQAVLAARIDLLAPEDKGLLQMAAVIGPEVPFTLLQALAELSDERLQTSLSRLQAAEFLYERSLFPELIYTFKHALTQEVAYSSLLPERRQALHARLVEILETLTEDQVEVKLERLAHHALRGEVWDKVVIYGRQAGEKAMAQSAHREAATFFEQALRALSRLPEQTDAHALAIDLRLALRSALRPLGEFERVLTYLHEAESLAAALDDPCRLGLISGFLSQHLRMMGAHDQAVAAAQRALALATASGNTILCALTNQYLGCAYHVQGNYHRATDCLTQTIVSLSGEDRHERFGQIIMPAVNSRAWIAVSHAELGRFTEGRVLGDEGVQMAVEIAHPDSLINAYRGVGLLALRQGDVPRALQALERAMDIGRAAEVSNTFLNVAPSLGAVYTLEGRVDTAVPMLTQALEQILAQNLGENLVFCYLSLAEARLHAGCLGEARSLADRALVFACAHQERGNEAYALRLLGEIAARCEPSETTLAMTYYRNALALAEELGMRPLQAHCHLGFGTLYARTGQRQQAHTALSVAIDLYRAMDMTFWLPQAEAALAQLA